MTPDTGDGSPDERSLGCGPADQGTGCDPTDGRVDRDQADGQAERDQADGRAERDPVGPWPGRQSELDRSPDHSDRGATTDAPTDSDTQPGEPMLDCHVVEYDQRADRATVSPPELDGDARMATWISLDRSAMRSLDECR